MTAIKQDIDLSSTCPTTEAQREVLAAASLGPDATRSYNESLAVTLDGPLDMSRLERSINHITARHESLRATFSADGTTMLIAPPNPVEVPLIDLTGFSERERSGRLSDLLVEEVERVIDLHKGPVARFRVIRESLTRHHVVFSAHHVVCDGWSIYLVAQELGEIYSALATADSLGNATSFRIEPDVLNEPTSFATYARSPEIIGEGPDHAADRAYWLERYAEIPSPIDLPTDRPRPPMRTFRSRRVEHELAPDLVAGLRKVGAKAGCSLFVSMTAAFDALLFRLTGCEDLVVGVPAAGQSAMGMLDLVGHCVNLLPIRSRVNAGMTFRELLKAVRGDVLDARDHWRYTFGSLVRERDVPRDPGRVPLVSVMFNLDQPPAGDLLSFTGLAASCGSTTARRYENFDWSVNIVELREGAIVECQYDEELFDHETMVDRLRSFAALIRGVVGAPDATVGELPILDRDQHRAIVVEPNQTDAEYPKQATVHSLFEEQVAKQPTKVAVRFENATLTYEQLNARANQIAGRLATMGVGPGELVAILLDRSPDMLAAALGVLKAGGGYVPLDPSHPIERRSFVMEDAAPRAIITTSDRQGDLAAGAPVILVDQDIPPDAGASLKRAEPSDVAYVLHTSGSTGKPKGVRVPHGTIVNYVTSMARNPGCGADDVVLAITTFSFDIAVTELFLPLSVGAEIVLVGSGKDGRELGATIDENGVTLVQATPATWRLLLEADWPGRRGLKALCGGEAMPPDIVEPLLPRVDSLWNMYGPTETTVWSTFHHVTQAEDRIPIGRPLANTRCHVVDPRGEVLPVGVPGELLITGAGVTYGYLNRPDLTDERFIENPYHDPFVDWLSLRAYRTGDIVRRRADGVLEYLRRNDDQVKVRGFRIELGEIESALSTLPGARAAAALAREVRPGDARIVAYVVPEPGEMISSTQVRKHLRKKLPEYMIPQHVVEMDVFPLTPSGKVDRKRLPDPFGEVAKADQYEEPANEVERLLAGIWKEVLDVPRVGRTDRFFDLGGHSLLAMRVISRVEEMTGHRVSPRALLSDTVAVIAEEIPAAGRTSESVGAA